MPQIRDAHLLLAAFNAWQPGVFALSGWDLLGIADGARRRPWRTSSPTGDTRWIERGAHDLLGVAPDTDAFGVGHAPGPVALRSAAGTARRRPTRSRPAWANMLRVRTEYGIASARQVDVPEVAHRGMLVMVHELESTDETGEPVVQITVLNMTDTPLDGTIRSESLPHGATVVDATDHSELGTVDDLCSFPLRIDAYGSRFLVLRRNVEQGA